MLPNIGNKVVTKWEQNGNMLPQMVNKMVTKW